jgi:hypothetical protein
LPHLGGEFDGCRKAAASRAHYAEFRNPLQSHRVFPVAIKASCRSAKPNQRKINEYQNCSLTVNTNVHYTS